MIIACMASIFLLASLPVLHPAKAIWPHSNALLIWGMVIPSPVRSLVTSSMVTLSDNCASVMCGIVAIVRHNSSTRCQYNPSVNNNCAMWMRNTLLVQCAIIPHGALAVTNNRPLINDRLIPYQDLRIHGHVATSLGYLHNHIAHSSGGSVVWGVFILTSVFGLLCLVSFLASAGTHLGVFYLTNAVFCIGLCASLASRCTSRM